MCFININSCNHHVNLIRLPALFYGRERLSIERLNHLPQVTQLLCGGLELGSVTGLCCLSLYRGSKGGPSGSWAGFGERSFLHCVWSLRTQAPHLGASEGVSPRPLLSCPWPGSFLPQEAGVFNPPCSGRARQQSAFSCGSLAGGM